MSRPKKNSKPKLPEYFACERCATVFQNRQRARKIQRYCSLGCFHSTKRLDPAEKLRRNAEGNRIRRAADPGRHRADVAAWKAANPDKYQAGLARRRARYAADAQLRERMRVQNEASYRRKQASTAEDRAARAKEKKQHAAARRDVARERGLKKSKEWRLANPEKYRALQRAWRKANRAKLNAKKRARKIAKRKATIAYLMARQHGACAYCRTGLAGIKVHVDHIFPRALGGSNERKNLQLTCEPCNLAKGAQPPEKFVLQFGRLI